MSITYISRPFFQAPYSPETTSSFHFSSLMSLYIFPSSNFLEDAFCILPGKPLIPSYFLCFLLDDLLFIAVFSFNCLSIFFLFSSHCFLFLFLIYFFLFCSILFFFLLFYSFSLSSSILSFSYTFSSTVFLLFFSPSFSFHFLIFIFFFLYYFSSFPFFFILFFFAPSSLILS
ncbi:unnamed protein product [Acanthosepion pharaonis]|uniref:Uncharacterized protein n=1 Tax=Acanthosepion pharaonis TaxID=158019 RepID=A0A812CER4_ACAPH|nr:unnamed protein product [Sepia pharaonis]